MSPVHPSRRRLYFPLVAYTYIQYLFSQINSTYFGGRHHLLIKNVAVGYQASRRWVISHGWPIRAAPHRLQQLFMTSTGLSMTSIHTVFLYWSELAFVNNFPLMNILAEIIKVQNESILFIYLLPQIVTIELLA